MKAEIILDIVVKTSHSKTELIGKTAKGELKLNIAAPPVKGRANLEIIKFFQKRYQLKAEIIRGKTGKKKKIRLYS